MRTTDIARKAMKDSRVTQLEMATKLSLSQSSVNLALTRQDMKFETMVKMLNICGYTIEIRNPTGEVEYSFKPEVSSDEKDC